MRVLFVCVHNSGRSQMAEAYVNHLSRQHDLDVVAESAGTVGGDGLNPAAVDAMSEEGISMHGHHPKLVTQEMVERADRIISMGCGVDAEACPTRIMLTEDWKLGDPAGQPLEAVRKVRDQIRDHVEAMLELDR
jgi:arsenate reductase (thioredoxin)